MKNLFLRTALLVFSTTIFSQETTVEGQTDSEKKIAIGIRYGIGINTLSSKNLGSDNLSALFSPLNIGVIIEGNISESFAIQPEIQFIQKGFSSSSIGTPIDIKVNYLGINVLPKVKLGNENIEASLIVGPSLNTKLSAISYSNGQSTNVSGMESIDFGIIFGGGIASKFKSGKVFLDLRYNIGLTDISSEKPKTSTDRLNQLGINLGVLFNIK